jgi:hypothetical protein
VSEEKLKLFSKKEQFRAKMQRIDENKYEAM